jgi:hypothetical protein
MTEGITGPPLAFRRLLYFLDGHSSTYQKLLHQLAKVHHDSPLAAHPATKDHLQLFGAEFLLIRCLFRPVALLGQDNKTRRRGKPGGVGSLATATNGHDTDIQEISTGAQYC